MKKRTTVLLTLFAVIATHVMAVDLWNGLTTDMTKAEAVAKACEILQVSKPVSEREPTRGFPLNFTVFDANSPLKLNDQFPPPQLYVSFKSPLPAYQQSYSDNNVRLYFYKDKLFGVMIDWASSFSDFLPVIKKQYGNPQTLEDKFIRLIDSSYVENLYYIWKPKGKTIWIYGGVPSKPGTHKSGETITATMKIADQTAIDQYVAEKQRAEQKRKAEEEAKQKAAKEGISF